MAEFIITRYGSGLLGALREDNRITEFHCQKTAPYQVGDIYIGKIQNIVKNLNAAFVSFGADVNGYVDLTFVESFFFTKQARMGKATIGDELLLQLEKEAVKTKLPVLSGRLNFSGQCVVLIHGDSGISVSRKIHDDAFKSEMTSLIKEAGILPEDCGLILRTNAEEYSREHILGEIKALVDTYQNMLQVAPYRTCFSRLYEELQTLGKVVRDYPCKEGLTVITDVKEIYDQYKSAFPGMDIQLYEDPQLSLFALYSIESALNEALGKRVWLKSGGYLIIEPTEALTVIDVNTGKAIQNKNKEMHFLSINLEAAKELAVQLRLRNYSGIILVDFIDLKEKENTDKLLAVLSQELKKDRTKTSYVDMTRLHLAEITRKRITKPLHEAIGELRE